MRLFPLLLFFTSNLPTIINDSGGGEGLLRANYIETNESLSKLDISNSIELAMVREPELVQTLSWTLS